MKIGRIVLKRAGAVLCTALMLVFVQAAAASSVAQLQHAVSGPDQRHTLLFTDMTLDDDHHAAGQHHEDHVADYGAAGHHSMPPGHGMGDGHHHHHGDVGASVMVLGSSQTASLHDLKDLRRPDPALLIVKVRQSLPERPPRTATSQA